MFRNIYLTLMIYAYLAVSPGSVSSVKAGMFDSIITALKSVISALMDFIFAFVSVIIDFIKSIVVNFFDFIMTIFSFLWSIFQWFKKESLAVLYNIFKDLVSSLNIPFPANLTQNITDAYLMLNVWFPADAAIDIGIVLINTWILVLSIKLGFKVKLLIGGLISKPLFK